MKPDIEHWFADTKLPAEAVIRRVRNVILRADPRLAEYVKNRTLTFGYRGDMAAFVQLGKKQYRLGKDRKAAKKKFQELMALDLGPAESTPKSYTIRTVCKVGGKVEFAPVGSLPNDGKVIDDVRKYT